MKRLRLSTLLLAASMALPAVSEAQVVRNLKFEGVKNTSVNLNGYGIGPYQASILPAGSKFDIFCIDFDNHAQAQWRGRFLTFADAVSAPNIAGVQRVLGNVPAWNIVNLRAGAYLASQFSTAPTSDWDDIHGAIWSMFSNSNTPHVGNYSTFANNAVNYALANPSAFEGWNIIVDENAFDANYTGPLNQTFLTNDGGVTVHTVTPEPSTYALFGSGLLALGYIRRRRQRNNA